MKQFLSLGLSIALAACSPAKAPQAIQPSSAAPSVQPTAVDAATIEDVTTEDKLTTISTSLSPLRHDLTAAGAQAAKMVAREIAGNRLAVGSEIIGIGVMYQSADHGPDIVFSLSYRAAWLKAQDFDTLTDAQVLEASTDTTFSQSGALDAQEWCLGYKAEAPAFCAKASK